MSAQEIPGGAQAIPFTARYELTLTPGYATVFEQKQPVARGGARPGGSRGTTVLLGALLAGALAAGPAWSVHRRAPGTIRAVR